MKPSGFLLFPVLISFVHCSGYYNSAKWHCGIDRVTETISEWLAKPFDYHGVNQCCQDHDDHYYHHTLSRDEADQVFCRCLEHNANWFVRNLIEPIFCKSVQTYAIWQKVTNQSPWSASITTTTTSTTPAFTTTKKSYNYYLELIRKRQKELELKKQKEQEEIEQANEKFRREWYLFQQFRKQKAILEWNL
uniref:Phospholipase A(2) n=1 Tax=Caenorhabditis japonica TaxID=281687 RepID=A0A8R1I874_CAEJA